MRYDSVVIGAGLSGLVCALLLARHGRKVAVVEQHPQPAPVVRGFSRSGHYFDTGFHYAGGLGEEGSFARLLRHLGLLDKLELTPYDASGFDRLRILSTGETLSLPVGYERIEGELSRRFPQAGQELSGYLKNMEQNWWRFPYMDVSATLNSFAAPTVHGETLAQQLGKFADWPELQSLLSMHSLLYGVDPEETPVPLNMQVAGSYYHSVHGIRGGGRSLVGALGDMATAAGVEIFCGQAVAAIKVDSAGVAGVELIAGEQLDAAEVIATCNPVKVPDLLPEGVLRPVYRKRLATLKQTSSAYLLFATVSDEAGLLHQRNLFIQQQAGLFGTGKNEELCQRSMYLTLTESAPQKKSSLVAIVPAAFAEVAAFAAGSRGRATDYGSHKQEVTDKLLNYIQSSCPELTGLEAVALATPLTLRDYSLAPQGAIYGAGHCSGQYNPQAQTRIPGLLLSGQGTAAPGFLGVVVAAYLTVGSLVGHDLLLKEVRLCH